MPRMTDATCKVLLALTKINPQDHYGLAIAKATGLKPGTLYPILARLEEEGLVKSDWEDLDEASAAKRRRRRLYELTAPGITCATDAAVKLTERTPVWARPTGGAVTA
jgi:PadR family transcriptional regulator PadR